MKNNNQNKFEKGEQNDELLALENVRKVHTQTHRRRRKQTRFLDKISNDPLVMNA